jgi:hypothetical protein
MSGFTPPNGMPKDINNRLGGVKGLNPEDPNDTAFNSLTAIGAHERQRLNELCGTVVYRRVLSVHRV